MSRVESVLSVEATADTLISASLNLEIFMELGIWRRRVWPVVW